MKRKYAFKLAVPTVLLGLAMAMPAFAQNESTHDAMHSAGANLKQAGSDTAAAAEDVYRGGGGRRVHRHQACGERHDYHGEDQESVA